MREMKFEVPKEEIDALFTEWDPDNSGALELKELSRTRVQLRVVPPVRAPTKTSRVKPRPPPHLRLGAAAARAGRRALLQPAAHGGRGRAALRTAMGRGAYTRALHRLLQPSPSLNPNPEAPAPAPTPKPDARGPKLRVSSPSPKLKPSSPSPPARQLKI